MPPQQVNPPPPIQSQQTATPTPPSPSPVLITTTSSEPATSHKTAIIVAVILLLFVAGAVAAFAAPSVRSFIFSAFPVDSTTTPQEEADIPANPTTTQTNTYVPPTNTQTITPVAQTSASASVDQTTYPSQPGPFILSGTAKNTKVLTVLIRGAGYIGSQDWKAVMSASNYVKVVVSEENPYGTEYALINGHWKAQFPSGNWRDAKLQVLVYNGSCDKNSSCGLPIASATLTPVAQPVVSVTPTFSASPSTGAAPLYVRFTATGMPEGAYRVEFGDGKTGIMPCPPVGNTTDCETESHTYTTPGTYTVRFVRFIELEDGVSVQRETLIDTREITVK